MSTPGEGNRAAMSSGVTLTSEEEELMRALLLAPGASMPRRVTVDETDSATGTPKPRPSVVIEDDESALMHSLDPESSHKIHSVRATMSTPSAAPLHRRAKSVVDHFADWDLGPQVEPGDDFRRDIWDSLRVDDVSVGSEVIRGLLSPSHLPSEYQNTEDGAPLPTPSTLLVLSRKAGCDDEVLAQLRLLLTKPEWQPLSQDLVRRITDLVNEYVRLCGGHQGPISIPPRATLQDIAIVLLTFAEELQREQSRRYRMSQEHAAYQILVTTSPAPGHNPEDNTSIAENGVVNARGIQQGTVIVTVELKGATFCQDLVKGTRELYRRAMSGSFVLPLQLRVEPPLDDVHEPYGWDMTVIPKITPEAFHFKSPTVVEIHLPAVHTYVTTVSEEIVIEVPATAVESGHRVTETAFTIRPCPPRPYSGAAIFVGTCTYQSTLRKKEAYVALVAHMGVHKLHLCETHLGGVGKDSTLHSKKVVDIDSDTIVSEESGDKLKLINKKSSTTLHIPDTVIRSSLAHRLYAFVDPLPLGMPMIKEFQAIDPAEVAAYLLTQSHRIIHDTLRNREEDLYMFNNHRRISVPFTHTLLDAANRWLYVVRRMIKERLVKPREKLGVLLGSLIRICRHCTTGAIRDWQLTSDVIVAIEDMGRHDSRVFAALALLPEDDQEIYQELLQRCNNLITLYTSLMPISSPDTNASVTSAAERRVNGGVPCCIPPLAAVVALQRAFDSEWTSDIAAHIITPGYAHAVKTQLVDPFRQLLCRELTKEHARCPSLDVQAMSTLKYSPQTAKMMQGILSHFPQALANRVSRPAPPKPSEDGSFQGGAFSQAKQKHQSLDPSSIGRQQGKRIISTIDTADTQVGGTSNGGGHTQSGHRRQPSAPTALAATTSHQRDKSGASSQGPNWNGLQDPDELSTMRESTNTMASEL